MCIHRGHGSSASRCFIMAPLLWSYKSGNHRTCFQPYHALANASCARPGIWAVPSCRGNPCHSLICASPVSKTPCNTAFIRLLSRPIFVSGPPHSFCIVNLVSVCLHRSTATDVTQNCSLLVPFADKVHAGRVKDVAHPGFHMHQLLPLLG